MHTTPLLTMPEDVRSRLLRRISVAGAIIHIFGWQMTTAVMPAEDISDCNLPDTGRSARWDYRSETGDGITGRSGRWDSMFDEGAPGRGTMWFARIVVIIVFIFNLQCAFSFIFWPDAYVASYELSGVPGRVVIRAMGILFLMWNATYPPVIWNPQRHRLIFGIVVGQQAIGLIGETFLWLSVQATNVVLAGSLMRFIIFDGIGLVLMGIAFALVMRIPESHLDIGYIHLGPHS